MASATPLLSALFLYYRHMVTLPQVKVVVLNEIIPVEEPQPNDLSE